MITQNSILDFMTKVPTGTNEPKKNEKTDFNSFTPFKDFLGKASNDVSMLKVSAKEQHQDDKPKFKTNNDVEQGSKFKSFTEAANKSVQKSSNEKSDAKSSVNSSDNETIVKGKQKDEKTTKTKEDVAVDTLAQVLGVKPDDLMKVLEKLNISTKDILDATKTDEIVSKLSDFLGLDVQQKQALTELVKTVDIKINENVKLTESNPQALVANDNSKTNDALTKDVTPKDVTSRDLQGMIKLDNKDIKVINQDQSTGDLKAIVESMKAKVEMLAQKLQQNPQKAADELNKLIETLTKKNGSNGISTSEIPEEAVINTTKEATQLPEDQKLQADVEKTDTKQNKADAGGKSEKKENGSKENSASDASQIKLQGNQESKVNSSQDKTPQFNNIIANQTQKVDNQNIITKVQKDAPIPKSEIINQVVEKAKVVLSSEKSEMVMDLKPDNLGKLALKVVTERGMVVAKFVAESQQVKEVLESNMQLLKDALEKQGLSVQGFSVSVQQDSSKGYNRFNEAKDGEGKGNHKSGIIDANMVNVAKIPEDQHRLNPYSWLDNKINLTA